MLTLLSLLVPALPQAQEVQRLQGPPPPPASIYWVDLEGDGDQDAVAGDGLCTLNFDGAVLLAGGRSLDLAREEERYALFLEYFVTTETDWVHIDTWAWNQGARPGRPPGGEAIGLRAVFHYLKKRYG